jgi:hypothetical protein
LYFLDFRTLTLRSTAPLLGQAEQQLSQPSPSQASQQLLFLLPNKPKQHPLPLCQGKTTFGMQMVSHSTSKQDFSTSTSSAVNLQRQSGQVTQQTPQHNPPAWAV